MVLCCLSHCCCHDHCDFLVGPMLGSSWRCLPKMGLFPPSHPVCLAEEGEYFLKVLIPSYAAGSIIGKGGQTIVQLQKETGATIKLSKSKDFYPGKPQTHQLPELDLSPLHFPEAWV